MSGDKAEPSLSPVLLETSMEGERTPPPFGVLEDGRLQETAPVPHLSQIRHTEAPCLPRTRPDTVPPKPHLHLISD